VKQETYPRKWKWPKGEKIAVSVGLAFEAFNLRSQFTTSVGGGKVDHFSISYGEYGWKAGVWRLMDLMDKYGLKANMSVNGLAAERHPEVVAAVAKLGHEINGHGWANDHTMKDDNPEEEEREIERCTKVLTEAAGVAPVGWTSPGSAGSRNTLTMLKRAGYLWNGDDASDDLPFLRDSDLGPMVMMPRTNTPHNDLSMWLAPRNPPSIIWDNFKNSFDTLYEEGAAGWPKWTEITIHCHIGARPALQPVLKQCFEYAQSHSDVWFARRRDIAEYAMGYMTKEG
jgi:peptidoglycan/xylan/chitin deacetylase (PgdA/CDA1 family)